MADVVILGAGPAGLAAARRAIECGARVTMVDDNPAPGGQIWRAMPIPGEWISKPEVIYGARVIAQPEPNSLMVETFDSELQIRFRSLILATGARERFLPFPGWTLPHVMGAGGLQALAKSGMPIAGKKVVIAGSGPLLLAVAKYLRDHGASIVSIAEQADQTSLVRFGLSLAAHPGKLLQAAQLRGPLLGIPYRTSCWPVAAAPGSVTLRRGGKSWAEACDYLACGFGLIPNTETAALLGCRLNERGAAVDEFQKTSVPGVYAAGEITGIGGLELSLVEGEIAGYAAAGRLDHARRRFAARDSHRKFADALERAFALRDEIRALPDDDTLICRCEDVSVGRVRGCSSWREAKLHTRCGMGPCQGRICGGAGEFLFGWKSESVRPPVFPARIGSLTR
jgi:NADPH-dependent 2,4-dienoyl-CoA reductase/sulfur reductase-like enzyme